MFRLIISLSFVTFLSLSLFADEKQVVNFGVYEYAGFKKTKEKYEPLVNYLNETLKHEKIVLHILKPDAINNKIKNNQLDIVSTNPIHFLAIRTNYQIGGVMATLVDSTNGVKRDKIAGLIVTRADNDKINSLKDIKAKSVATPQKTNMGSFRAQLYELYKQNITINDLQSITEAETNENVIDMVLNKKVDVGFIRTGLLNNNDLKFKNLKIINPLKHNDFPEIVSTALYPEWPVFAMAHMDERVVGRIASALFLIEPNILGKNGIYGYSVPADYIEVEKLAMALRLPPYEKAPDFSLIDIWNKMQEAVILLAISFIMIIFLLIKLSISMRHVKLERSIKSSLLSSMGEGVISTDEKLHTIYINQKALDMLGYTQEELHNKHHHDILHHHRPNTEPYPKIECPIYKTSTDKISRSVEEWFIKKDGTFLPVHLTVTALDIGGVVIVFRDITSSITQQLETEQEKKKFETIFNLSKDGVAILDLKSNFLEFNQAYLEMTGYTREELLQQSCIGLTIPEDVERSKEAIRIVHEKGFLKDFEKGCLIKNGKRLTINMSITLMPDKDSILISTKDITEQKKFAHQSKLIAMGEMIGNIAHQWRQPLSVISTVSSGIKVQNELGILEHNDIGENMSAIMNQVQYLSKTIDDFRNFIRDEIATKEIIPIEQLINKTLSLIKSSLYNEHITTVTDLKEKFEIHGFENELIQSLINIVNNAKDAMKEHVPSQEDRFIFIKTFKNEANQNILELYDSGGGIPKNVIDRIFEPYFTTKHKSIGTGIGLAMCKKIIEEHHNAVLNVHNVEYTHNDKNHIGACFQIVFMNE